jgi:ribosomal protein S8
MHYTNHIISYFITRLNYGAKKRLRFLKIEYNDAILELLAILYKNGAIRSFRLREDNLVDIYFKYNRSKPALKIVSISKPGNRIF